MNKENELDIRNITRAKRHSLIFEWFDKLLHRGAFVLVNDHDPRALYYQFRVERPGAFAWKYVEAGPESWRVRIGRI